MAAQIFKSKLVGAFLFCLLISKLSLFECAPDVALDVQLVGEEYTFIMDAVYKTEIEKLAAKITQTEMTFNKQLALLETNEELSVTVVQKAVARLRARGALNIQGKMCVQNLVGKLTADIYALQLKLRACVDTARKGALLFSAGSRKQEVHTREQLGLALNDLPVCYKDAAGNSQKLADCIWNKWKPRESTAANHLKLGNKEIDDAVPKYDALVKVAHECSYKHILDAQTLLAEMYFEFNLCVGDKPIDI